MRAVVLAVAALIFVPAAWAGGSVNASVPAPTVGKTTVQEVEVTATGSAKSLAVKVTNRKALQKGFGAIGIVVDPKTAAGETFQIFLVMFMGNFSTSPATSVQFQITPPAGVTLSKPKLMKPPKPELCLDFVEWNTGFESGKSEVKSPSGKTLTIEQVLPPYPGWDISSYESYLDGTLPGLWSYWHCPGSPEDASSEPGGSPK